MIKGVFFDFFGVLYPDTFWGLANKYLIVRDEKIQQAMHDLVKRADLNMIDQDTFWQEAAQIYGVPLEQVLVDRDAFGGVDGVLMSRVVELKKKGLKLGIISNVGSDMIQAVLGDRADLFDVMVLSGDTGYIKPDSKIYILATEKIGLKPAECVFFDDIPRNVRGAEAIGMKAAHYTGIHDFDAAMERLMTDMDDESLV